LLRKLIAAIGGGGCFYVFRGDIGSTPEIVASVLLGLVGGVVLASLVGGLAGLARPNVTVDRAAP
jgi:hypothetical protein